MDSKKAFQVMENFTRSINDLEFQNSLLKSLTQSQPFRNFKRTIDHSDHRQHWFNFKTQAYIEWVTEQIN